MDETCPSLQAAENAADRDRIRSRVIQALREANHDEGSVDLDGSFVLDTEDGELRIPIELIVRVDRRPALLVKCVRGHLSTRERASVSLARLLAEHPVPFAIVANERDAVVIDAMTGKAVGQGYGAFPRPEALRQRLEECADLAVPPAQRERERRILAAYYHLRCSVDREPF